MSLTERIGNRVFRFVHSNNLVYNTCWEDPRLDREALKLGPEDRVLVITSAGCNALDYALQSPAHVHAVDMNPRQNALLELKLAGIRTLEYEDFFELFGRGRHRDGERIYKTALRAHLSPPSQEYWDKKFHFFTGKKERSSFYFRGTTGLFARLLNVYIDKVAKVRGPVDEILGAGDIGEQQRIYDAKLREVFWTKKLRWFVGRDSTLSLLGVPRPQRKQVEKHFTGGIAQFIEDCVESVFTALPIADNYFWRVYLTGQYTKDCCPEYLREENFTQLKDRLGERVSVHTDTVEGFLRKHDGRISRFVLLDHMDWLSSHNNAALQAEWQAIVEKAAPGARVIFRSGGMNVDFVDPVMVKAGGQTVRVGDLLTYDRDLAARLHERDRVHTYGSFYIADLAAATA